MKNIKNLVFILLGAFMFSISASAQSDKRDDSHYLAGAVPEQNGRVVFSKVYVVNGMSKDVIYDKLLKYLTARMAQAENPLSRVAYANKDEGVIAALGNEWMVFSKSALSLDRSGITYQLTATCSEGKCQVVISKINFTYREKEKYTAEEWITDKIALNKDKTKLIRGIAKWRRHTVDLCDDFFTDIKDELSGKEVVAPVVKPVVSSSSSDPVVIGGDNKTAKDNSKPDMKTEPVPVVSIEPELQTISADNLPSNATSVMSKAKVVVVVGDDSDNMVTMTATKGASMGVVGGKQMVFAYFDLSQATAAVDNVKEYQLKFIDPKTRVVLISMKCKRSYAETEHGLHVLAGTISEVKVNKDAVK